MFLLVRIYKAVKYPAYRKASTYGLIGALLTTSLLLYTVVLNERARVIFGGTCLLLLCVLLMTSFFRNR